MVATPRAATQEETRGPIVAHMYASAKKRVVEAFRALVRPEASPHLDDVVGHLSESIDQQLNLKRELERTRDEVEEARVAKRRRNESYDALRDDYEDLRDDYEALKASVNRREAASATGWKEALAATCRATCDEMLKHMDNERAEQATALAAEKERHAAALAAETEHAAVLHAATEKLHEELTEMLKHIDTERAEQATALAAEKANLKAQAADLKTQQSDREKRLVTKLMASREQVTSMEGQVAERDARIAALEASAAKATTDWDDQHRCVVCLDEIRTHAFSPCCHVCTCVGCADNVMAKSKEYPICCQGANSAFQIYLA